MAGPSSSISPGSSTWTAPALTVLFTHASHIELIATPLLAPVLTISGLADITRLHGIGSGADGSGLSANPG